MTVHNDTVDNAKATPDHAQPFRELGLKDDEYQRIVEILGRRPTDAELTVYSVMWSEHCSYKSSKVHLRYFGETMTEEMGSKLLAGIGENAGVVDIGGGDAVTFRVESHNHPSFIEPYQGAATGVGGIVRDIMAMGARPIAVMDQLRFGPADAQDTKRVLPGVVAGIGGYGNSLGLPNIGGETVFDETYASNPLVNALCVGTLKVEDLKLAFASGAGNKVILFGSRTGLDGIGGVSVLASESFEDGAERKLPAVQVGDPFAEKVLIECCLELYHSGVVVGIQDLGGAGLACATSELAASGDGGMRVDLDAVPLRAENMTAAEILASESQERMCAVVEPDNVERFMAICAKWDVNAAVIGEVTGEADRLIVSHQGEVVVDAPPSTIADEAPVYDRPWARPAWQDDVQQPAEVDKSVALVDAWLRMVASPALCSRDFITQQYDRYVRGNTVQAQHANSGVLRINEESNRGVAVSADASGRYTFLDPNMGARLALAEAYRNVAVTGARPVAITNCLNFGSPENPDVMWQFREAVHGLADGAVELGIPVSGGNVSFYNQTGDTPILPTPVVGVLGVIDNVEQTIGHALPQPPDSTAQSDFKLLLLGHTHDEFGGSVWQEVSGRGLSGLPPQVDLANEQRLAQFFADSEGISAAHDLSEGGLAQAVFEMLLGSGKGAELDVTGVHEDAFTALFSESASRVLVAVTADRVDIAVHSATAAGIPVAVLGSTNETGEITVAGETVSIAQLAEAWSATLPGLFDHALAPNSPV
ncbi:phosphoribosylformylglycinamidine synthase subunit PurL [Corynebacterium lipophiloflavum]|uniref:Phosphoribosylformylglycinamidine synthase subunit PurL n=1 Tax=Corynebacterium lipophiloflavum (strain ATCC 700352 / DSM 44291 / CCUG 37336 / JCM 10383 / DMMZ 1944) TaxID=525263 RepID=C0XPA7_CORLD|nr:phosphoribosylformylglycinamidine synthase subunit PurL [Corynebacterium lipophiloflavum]EEI17938.1 phosphoribosylformylglycinamidine synthase II [Corynebacterium lipophiloflavum DSM 44291]